ncbi:MAG TPA: penicillin-binding protein 1C [Vicinamibacteria bacterium]
MRVRRGLGVLCVLCGSVWLWLRCGPLPPGFLDPAPRVSTEVVDRNGEPLYEALSAGEGRSRLLSAEALPQNLVRATLAAEDARFYHHPGVDPLALARAAWHNLRARRWIEGGSTLTQQAVKVLIRRPRTARGKLREVVLALRLEHRLPKAEVLALYLNVAPYGNQLAGAEAASRAYFGCAAAELTPAQAALLAGLPQRPSALNPYRNLAGALTRQRWVLERMAALGYLTPEELAAARAERLEVRRAARAFAAPHFVERALAEQGEDPPRRVETTLDAGLQAELRGILEMHRARLEAHGAHNVAVAVLDNARGEWLAWEGSGDYGDDAHGGAIDGVVAPRQPGSALKPFTYALAFERGFTPATVLPDLPAHFPTAQPGVLYSPRNYDGVFRGPLRARAALAGSENVPAVWLLSQLGVPDLLRLLRRAGFSTLDKSADHYGYALTMGDAEVPLAELVTAYSALARGGVFRRPRMVRRVTGAGGVVREEPEGEAERILSPRAAFWVAEVLADARARAYVFGRGGSLEFPFPVAVKTGTSQAYRDNWTVGFTREVTVGVWVGNFDRQELRQSSGVTGAAPIFHDVLLAAQKRAAGRLPEAGEAAALLDRPQDLERVEVCALSGQAATEHCPALESEWLPAGRAPRACSWHRAVHGRRVVAWPSRYRAWARASGRLEPEREAAAPPPVRALAVAAPRRAAAAEALHIVSPPDGGTYLIDPTLRAAFQTLPLRAVAAASAPLTWWLDGAPLGSASADRALDWPLARGSHTIAVTDDRGRRDEATILVK